MSDDVRMAARLLGNDIICDDLGLWSVMVPLPKLSCSDILTDGTAETHPAWIVDDKEPEVIWISKYQNVVHMDRAYSLPHKDPAANLNFDKAQTYCRHKGAGWHLMTNAEWAAIALWCKKNGTMPRGNNNYGSDISAPHEKAAPSMARDSSGRIQRVYTGSNNPAWYHNHNISGIEGLNGNVWERVGGMRLMGGEIQIIPNGNAMKPDCDMSASSTEWKAVLPDGTLVEPGTSGTMKYGTAWNNTKFSSITTTPAATGAGITLLESLGLIPHAGSTSADYGEDTVWTTLTDERIPLRGGHWTNGAPRGVFALNLSYVRSNVYAYIGFRSAYADPAAL